MVHYNLERHKQLLQEKQTSLQNNELRRYAEAIEAHFLWQERDQIILFLEKLLTGEIEAEAFCDFTNGLRRKVLEGAKKYKLELMSNPERIKNFQPDENGKKLDGLLTAFFCGCDNLAENDNRTEFYNSMNNLLSNLERVLNEN